MSEPRKIGNGWAMNEFWEMRGEILEVLADFEYLTATQKLESSWRDARYLILKIKSLESKYQGGER